MPYLAMLLLLLMTAIIAWRPFPRLIKLGVTLLSAVLVILLLIVALH